MTRRRVLCAVACAAVAIGARTERVGAQTVAGASAASAAADVVARRVDEDTIVAGDRIVLRVWREPTWSDAFGVDLDGNVELPRIGRVHAGGMLPGALADTVRTRLAAYLRVPNVDLVVLRRVAVLGAVMKPNVLFIDPVTSLSDVIAQAGGISPEGDPDRIEIVREGRHLRLGRWQAVSASSTRVRSGDQVVVGRRNWFARNGVTAISSLAVAVSVLVTVFRR